MAAILGRCVSSHRTQPLGVGENRKNSYRVHACGQKLNTFTILSEGDLENYTDNPTQFTNVY